VGEQGWLAHNVCAGEVAELLSRGFLPRLRSFSRFSSVTRAIRGIVENVPNSLRFRVFARVELNGRVFLDFNPTLRNLLSGFRGSALSPRVADNLLQALTGNNRATLGGLASGVHAEIGVLLRTAAALGAAGERGADLRGRWLGLYCCSCKTA